jgi:hypothetical protein
MKVPGRRSPRPTVHPLTFCEPGNAVAMGKHHLRLLSEETPPRGAGFPSGTTALCTRDLGYGWDLPDDVTDEAVLAERTPRPGDQHVWLCASCAAAFDKHVSAATPKADR